MTTNTENSIVLENYREFKRQLPQLLAKHRGKFVVFHNCELSNVFDEEIQAVRFARRSFEMGQYIVQEVHNRPPEPAPCSLLI